jgi:hypothetical protein
VNVTACVCVCAFVWGNIIILISSRLKFLSLLFECSKEVELESGRERRGVMTQFHVMSVGNQSLTLIDFSAAGFSERASERESEERYHEDPVVFMHS